MSIDGVNSQQQVKQVAAKEQVQATAQVTAQATAEALQSALNGTDRKSAQDLGALTPNERKELIKYYQECGYSKKEAEALFDSKAAKLEKMSRKEAKNWCKEYMQQNGCSKKEAKEAFKNEFGYDVPLSFGAKVLRSALFSSGVGAIVTLADKLSGGKLGVKKFVTGQGNNDVAYARRDKISL